MSHQEENEDGMARKYIEKRFSKARTSIPSTFKTPEPSEFYSNATPFVQRTLLFVADEDETVHEFGESEGDRVPKATPKKSPRKSFFGKSKASAAGEEAFKNVFFGSPSSLFKGKSEPSTSSASAVPASGAHTNEEVARGLISYAPGWSLKGEHLMKWQESGRTTIQIYTDWANHYLERARSRRRITNSLAVDCADGALLGDVIEGVIGSKVPRAHRKPKNQQQMLDNIQSCLDYLHSQHVQGLEQVTASDIREGKLKAVLALFFALSRHKQAAKQRNQPQPDAANSVNRITGGASVEEMLTVAGAVNMNRQLSASGGPGGVLATTCIPLPASASAQRRCPPDKGRPLPSTPSQGLSKPSGNVLSASSSRSTSPSQTAQLSFIPRAPSSGHGSRPNSSLIPPGSKIPSNPYATQQVPPCPPPTHNGPPQSKHSMLDKLKLFNKDKASDRPKGTTNVISKRTSSSSGFSSAKSERSDSSLSLNEASNSPSSHIRGPVTGSVPKSSRHIEQSKSSNKNIKYKLVNSNKLTKESSIINTNNKGIQKTNSSDRINRSSPKLREKESKIAPPKLVSNLKPQLEQDVKIPKPLKPHDTKIARLSGSHLRIPEPKMHSPTAEGPKVSPFEGKSLKQPKAPASNSLLLSNNTNPAFSSQTSVNSTGIPKPTAAVKGQTKIPKDERNPNLSVPKSMSTQMSPNHSSSNLNSSSGSLPFSRDSSMSKESTPQKQTLAVSPMPITNVKESGDSQNIASQALESSNLNSTGPHSNSSDSSIIHRPSSESSSEVFKPRHENYLNDVISEADTLEKEAAKRKLLEAAEAQLQYSLNRKDKERTMRTISENSPSHGRDNSLDDDNPTMNVLPMRPLLRGYNSHLTLPIRTSSLSSKNLSPGFPHHANTVKANFGRENIGNYIRDRSNYMGGVYSNHDYCDVDIMSGYMSDGDCLRRLNMSDLESSRNDILDGYLSEGGASIYGRRLQSAGVTLQPFDARCARQPSQTPASGPRPQMEGPGGGPPVPGGPHVVYRVVGQRVKKSDSGQQTDPGGGVYKTAASNGHSTKNGDSQWKKYTDSPGVGSPVQNAPPSPSHSRKSERRSGNGTGGHHSPSHQRRAEKLSAAQQLGVSAHHQFPTPSQHPTRNGASAQSPNPVGSPLTPNTSANSSSSSGGSGRVKGVPQSFGYAKRQGGQHQMQSGGRTAQVSAVPRTKVKVSGGTQTCTQDLQIHKNGCAPKSFSLGPTSAAQLSQSVRERLLGSQSLPKPGTHEFAALFQHHRATPRGGMKISDGSLSDTQTYSEVKSEYGSPYTPWLRHSNTYSAGGRLSDGESNESLSSPHGGTAQTQAHRAALQGKMAAQREGQRLNRSNSIRSTKSEKLYPSMLQRSSESDYEPYYCLPVQYGPPGSGISYGTSEPPSPSPRSALSPSHGPSMGMPSPMQTHGLPTSQLHSVRHSHHYTKKNDEVHGSATSLVSTASSLHGAGAAEERHAMEVRKLRRELADAKDKVHTLTTQLTTNTEKMPAIVVCATVRKIAPVSESAVARTIEQDAAMNAFLAPISKELNAVLYCSVRTYCFEINQKYEDNYFGPHLTEVNAPSILHNLPLFLIFSIVSPLSGGNISFLDLLPLLYSCDGLRGEPLMSTSE